MIWLARALIVGTAVGLLQAWCLLVRFVCRMIKALSKGV